MLQRSIRFVALALLPAAALLADFSYQQSSQITGGMMAGAMKFAGVFSKQAREPIQGTIAVKGDRLVNLTGNRASIIDLGKETITEVDFQKKTYSVMTFAEMAQMLEEASRKMKDSKQGQVNWKVSVNETGQTKSISGFDTKEVVLRIEMESQDPKSGQKGSMVVTTDMWMAPKVAGYDEITNFYKRMSEKIAWTPGGGMLSMGGSDMAKAMSEVMKEGSKLNGMPIYQVVKMGAAGQPGAQGGTPAEGQQQPQQQQPQATAERPSLGGALGGALGGRLGGFGGFGRKKKKQQQEEQPQPQQQAQAAPAQQGQADASGSLMEMTTQTSNFSSEAVDASKFEVPAGFKQVQPNHRGR